MFGSYPIKSVRIPHGQAGDFNGWYSHIRGAPIRRRDAVRVLFGIKVRGRIEHYQSNNADLLKEMEA